MSELTKWLKVVVVGLMAISQRGQAQPIQLDSVQEWARQNYPLIRQQGLLNVTNRLQELNLRTGWLPQVSVSGQASYQSEVTRINVPLPGFQVDPLSNDQYRLQVELNQLIYDGGQVRAQQKLQQLQTATEQQKLEVDLYRIREKVTQIYMNILYLRAARDQVYLVQQDLQTGLNKIEAQIKNGLTYKSNAQVLQAEQLRTNQRFVELNQTLFGWYETLGLYINRHLDTAVSLKLPGSQLPDTGVINRPELRLFQQQTAAILQQQNVLQSKLRPRASFFAQGGYGRPGLNMLKNEFRLFGITGVRLNWSLSSFYTTGREKKLLNLNRQMVELQQDAFLLNTRAEIRQRESDLQKYHALIADDDQIIDLRRQVKEAARAQLTNGVITANDYLREVYAEENARLSKVAHQILLAQTQENLRLASGH